MTVIKYARVSTTDQDLSIQEGALKAALDVMSFEPKRCPEHLLPSPSTIVAVRN
jgi:DNA invertase Pin-like site-specific DNA recombinase